VVFSVVDVATSWLRGEPETTSASIRLPPDCFGQPGSAALENALHRAGWRLDRADVNHHLLVGPSGRFLAELGETKRKELRRLDRSGATASEAGLEASRIYGIIAENRRSMGYPMTMAWPQVEALATAFPDRVRFFGVIRGGTILAGAICLRVTASYLYVFYWGERPEFRKESPVTLLADGLVAYAHAREVAVLDLGVSTEHSAPNAGLIAFKESLGCRASSRRIYTLDIS
jgi:predicted N-acyltransferase